ncbi:MAG TPA: OadG family protein [Acetomicrobium sp.]|nr:OadG family protein [Acetomicrobium sp.]
MNSVFEQGLYGGLQLSIIAFSMVFIVLGGLTLVIVAMKFIGRTPSKKAEETTPGGGEALVEETTIPSPPEGQGVAPLHIEEGISGEEIVAITAAIAAYSSGPFEIKSIRRIVPPRVSLWRKASFFENQEGFE